METGGINSQASLGEVAPISLGQQKDGYLSPIKGYLDRAQQHLPWYKSSDIFGSQATKGGRMKI